MRGAVHGAAGCARSPRSIGCAREAGDYVRPEVIHESGRVPRHRRHPARRRAGAAASRSPRTPSCGSRPAPSAARTCTWCAARCPGMKPGTILGHEGVGVVEELGADVRNLSAGDRVVIPSTIACGSCVVLPRRLLRAVRRRQPQRPARGHRLLRRPGGRGPVPRPAGRVGARPVRPRRPGEAARRGHATSRRSCSRTSSRPATSAPSWPRSSPATRWRCSAAGRWGSSRSSEREAARARAACSRSTDRVAARDGAGPGRRDHRLRQEDPVEAIRELTGGIGVDRAIDAVGVDAERARIAGRRRSSSRGQREAVRAEVDADRARAEPGRATTGCPATRRRRRCTGRSRRSPRRARCDHRRLPADASSTFPIGKAMNKNLTLNMGNCNHRTYIPQLLELVRTGAVDPTQILTHAGRSRRHRRLPRLRRPPPSWIKVELSPARAA